MGISSLLTDLPTGLLFVVWISQDRCKYYLKVKLSDIVPDEDAILDTSQFCTISASHLSALHLCHHTPPLTLPILLSLLREAQSLESLSLLGVPFVSVDRDPIEDAEDALTTSYVLHLAIDVESDVPALILRSLFIPNVETLTLVGGSGWFPLGDLFIDFVSTSHFY
jgi:hypothetical protein